MGGLSDSVVWDRVGGLWDGGKKKRSYSCRKFPYGVCSNSQECQEDQLESKQYVQGFPSFTDLPRLNRTPPKVIFIANNSLPRTNKIGRYQGLINSIHVWILARFEVRKIDGVGEGGSPILCKK